jgi:nucleoside-diphosphate-sugar epimerase|tara:strand:- start:43 stop:972 length:930 start_codon:yes stop_codon:yes gene_type:complete
MVKRIFVTGGAGYIGSTLIPILLEKNYEVTVYDNLSYGGEGIIHNFLNPNFKFIKGDILDVNHLHKSMEGHDVVIHLAAIVGYAACRRDEEMSHKINHIGTKNVISGLDGSQLLLYGSTGSNYGSVQGVCTEETPLNPLSIYAETKTLGEEEVLKYNNHIAYRFATAFGVSPRLRLDLLINDLSYTAFTQKYIAVYESHFMRTFIHIRDIAKSFLFAIDNQDKMKNEVFNVGDWSMNYSKRDVCEMIQKKTDCFVHYADFDGDADKRDYVVSYDKIKKIGYECTLDVEQGIDELIKVFPMIKIENKYRN